MSQWMIVATACVGIACGGPRGPAAAWSADLPGLAGSWRATRLALTGPGGAVDLVALGGAGWATFDADGRYVVTTQDPGSPEREANPGTWAAGPGGVLELTEDRATAPVTYTAAIAPERLVLDGPIEVDLDGDGQPESATLEAEFEREPDKLAEGSGVVGAWVRSMGRIRTYRLHLPPAAEGAGLILAFHGAGGRGAGIQGYSGLDAAADGVGAFVAYPDGIGGEWAAGCDCTAADAANVPDVAFVHTLVDQLAAEHPIDPGRIHAAGFSQGAMFAYRLACEIPERVASIAAVGAGLPRVLAQRCVPARPVPVVTFHGTLDPVVPFAGDATFLSSPETLAFWATADACGGSVVEPLVDATPDGTLVTRETFAGCAEQGEVASYSIEGGGHTWPGSPAAFPATVGPVSQDVSASLTAAEFFSRHPLR